MNRFGLQSTTPGNTTIAYGESSVKRSRSTTSFSSEPEILGREDDKNQIINILTSSSTSSATNSEKVSFISLVGMGGLGKTTLAQLVYRDYFIQKQFEPKMWVHVSECFDAKTILVNIMESISKTKSHSVSNLDVLVNEVREQLHGKKYLLVLDDVWNDDDQEQWEILKSALVVGAQGSKILITTRKDQVASIVRGTSPPYKLGLLPDAACWSMIEQRAFSPGGAPSTQEMIHIGKEIAKKCCGLPLAAKFLGGLLHSKYKESEWIGIRDDDIWNSPENQRKILPVLKLSYYNLPSHLKQCFSYCSIFPKNWEINIETLVHLWMAEGFLKQSDRENERSVEDIGRDYFESLAWSSFFQNFESNLVGDIETCKLHDLVHDLAEDVRGEYEVVSLKVSKLKDVSQVRRLQIELDEGISATSLKCLSNSKKLRALFIPEGSKLDPFIFLENNHHLRILHVGLGHLGSPSYSARPKWRSLSVKLKHLRYLRLTHLNLREVVYDQSIGTLYNLETLVLSQMGINVQFLLTNIQSLRKFRYLEVSYTYMVELPDPVTSLSNLHTLDLTNCELKVIPDSISGLKNLSFLNLSVNPFEKLPASVVNLSNLKALPESVRGLARLRIFDFKKCPLLEALPEDIGTLTQLRYLILEGTQINVLPESSSNLNNLEYVDLSNCDVPKYVKNWTKLRKFSSRTGNILGAGELIFLETLRYSVPKKYNVNEAECKIGIEELRNLNFLESLSIWDLQNVEDPMDAERANLKGKQNLRILCLHWDEMPGLWKSSRYLEVYEALQPPTGLRVLVIQNFRGRVFPDWMCVPSVLPNLVRLDLRNCTGIKTLPDFGGFPSLTELNLTDMHLLEELCYSCASLQDLWIIGCKSLKEIPTFPSLMRLELKRVDHKLVWSVGRSQTSLTELWLKNIEDLIYFPVSILQNNSNIHNLIIKGCNQLKGFGVNEDALLFKNTILGSKFYTRSLQQLSLIDCAVLKFLPDLREWTCLLKLWIFNCPKLKESLNYDLKSLSFLKRLYVDFIQRDEERGDPSTVKDLINLMNK